MDDDATIFSLRCISAAAKRLINTTRNNLDCLALNLSGCVKTYHEELLRKDVNFVESGVILRSCKKIYDVRLKHLDKDVTDFSQHVNVVNAKFENFELEHQRELAKLERERRRNEKRQALNVEAQANAIVDTVTNIVEQLSSEPARKRGRRGKKIEDITIDLSQLGNKDLNLLLKKRMRRLLNNQRELEEFKYNYESIFTANDASLMLKAIGMFKNRLEICPNAVVAIKPFLFEDTFSDGNDALDRYNDDRLLAVKLQLLHAINRVIRINECEEDREKILKYLSDERSKWTVSNTVNTDQRNDEGVHFEEDFTEDRWRTSTPNDRVPSPFLAATDPPSTYPLEENEINNNEDANEKDAHIFNETPTQRSTDDLTCTANVENHSVNNTPKTGQKRKFDDGTCPMHLEVNIFKLPRRCWNANGNFGQYQLKKAKSCVVRLDILKIPMPTRYMPFTESFLNKQKPSVPRKPPAQPSRVMTRRRTVMPLLREEPRVEITTDEEMVPFSLPTTNNTLADDENPVSNVNETPAQDVENEEDIFGDTAIVGESQNRNEPNGFSCESPVTRRDSGYDSFVSRRQSIMSGVSALSQLLHDEDIGDNHPDVDVIAQTLLEKQERTAKLKEIEKNVRKWHEYIRPKIRDKMYTTNIREVADEISTVLSRDLMYEELYGELMKRKNPRTPSILLMACLQMANDGTVKLSNTEQMNKFTVCPKNVASTSFEENMRNLSDIDHTQPISTSTPNIVKMMSPRIILTPISQPVKRNIFASGNTTQSSPRPTATMTNVRVCVSRLNLNRSDSGFYDSMSPSAATNF